MKPTIHITEPDAARRVTSDGRFWSEVAAALESLATRAAERGYVTDRLVLTGSGTDARDTWKVELTTTERERDRARELKAQVVEVPAPERFIDTKWLPGHVVAQFCIHAKIKCNNEVDLARAKPLLAEALKTASFLRDQDNGFELWRAKGRGAKHGSPRVRFLVSKHRIRQVLAEHDTRPRGKRAP